MTPSRMLVQLWTWPSSRSGAAHALLGQPNLRVISWSPESISVAKSSTLASIETMRLLALQPAGKCRRKHRLRTQPWAGADTP